MSRTDPLGEERHTDTDTTLRILDAVDRDGAQSQRAMAGDAGIALGLTNAYLRRCVRKGWVKVREAPARRYLYYITPQGFAEKARLTAEYLSSSFTLFRAARGQCDDVIAACERGDMRRVVLVGASDLAEIAALSALSSEIELVGIVDPRSNQSMLAGLPVLRAVEDIGDVDAVFVTDIVRPQETYESLAEKFSEDRIFTPPMLRIVRRRRGGSERAGRS